MAHLSDTDKDFLKKEFEKLVHPVNLVFFTQKFECQYCELTRELLVELSDLSDKINLVIYDFVADKEQVEKYKISRIPAVVVEGEKDYGIRFYGIPSGYEFRTLVDDIIDVSKRSSDLSDKTKAALKELTKPVHIQVFVTPTCPYCPAAVRLAHQMALESDLVTGDMIEASEFPQLSNKYGVYGVPKVVINENVSFEGSIPEPNYLEKVLEAEGSTKKS